MDFVLVILMAAGGYSSQSGVALSQEKVPFKSMKACKDAEDYYNDPKTRDYLNSAAPNYERKGIVLSARCWNVS